MEGDRNKMAASRPWGGLGPGGVLKLFFDGGPKPLPMSKDFSHSKNGWLDSIFLKFSQIKIHL